MWVVVILSRFHVFHSHRHGHHRGRLADELHRRANRQCQGGRGLTLTLRGCHSNGLDLRSDLLGDDPGGGERCQATSHRHGRGLQGEVVADGGLFTAEERRRGQAEGRRHDGGRHGDGGCGGGCELCGGVLLTCVVSQTLHGPVALATDTAVGFLYSAGQEEQMKGLRHPRRPIVTTSLV